MSCDHTPEDFRVCHYLDMFAGYHLYACKAETIASEKAPYDDVMLYVMDTHEVVFYGNATEVDEHSSALMEAKVRAIADGLLRDSNAPDRSPVGDALERLR